MRVATFNVRTALANDGKDAYDLRRDSMLEAIHRLRADILGVQEAVAVQVADISNLLPSHAGIGVGREDGLEGGEHMTLFIDRRLAIHDVTTFWFSSTPGVPGSRDWGNTNVRCCTSARLSAGNSLFDVFNLHLDHESGFSRRRSIELLLEKIEPGLPTLVLGDFNVGERDPILDRLRGRGFRDCYRHSHPSEALTGTFHGFTGVFEDTIDYIWSSQEWTIEDAAAIREQVAGRWPSDHAPVSADLSLSGRASPRPSSETRRG